MGTETYFLRYGERFRKRFQVKFNNPLMGTETS